jgi:hypothetical protein
MHTEPHAPSVGYDDDFFAWTVAQAAALRDGCWADIDVENLVEEIASLGASNKKEIRSRLIVMVMHLLKQRAQPDRASKARRRTLVTQATEINLVLDDSPSLRRLIPELIAGCYRPARLRASVETGLPLDQFPEQIPADVAAAVAAELERTSAR